jgi:hypothetical protein
LNQFVNCITPFLEIEQKWQKYIEVFSWKIVGESERKRNFSMNFNGGNKSFLCFIPWLINSKLVKLLGY